MKVKRILLPVLVISGVVVLFVAGDLPEKIRELLDALEGLGIWAPVVFVLLYIAACVLMIPGSLLTLGAGFLFGVVKGSLLVSVASTLGAICAFLVGRYLARPWVEKRITGNEKFEAMDHAVAGEGWKIVGLARLSPVFPFNLLNYAFGLTRVSLRDYAVASWIGMLPGTVMYVYLGSLASSLAVIGTQEHTRSAGEWALFGAGLVATILVTVIVTRIARKALNRKLDRKAER